MSDPPESLRSSALPVPEEIPPLSFGGIFRLFLQPRQFFSRCLEEDTFSSRYFALLILGMAAVINRFDLMLFQLVLAPEQVREMRYVGLLELLGTWNGFFPYFLGAALVSALMAWWIGGFFYYIRVRLAGDGGASFRDARTVMLYSTFVCDFPVVVHLLYVATAYDSYLDYWQAHEPWGILLALLPFWATVVSYQGVRIVFDTSVWRRRLLFLILPVCFYTLVLGLGVAGILAREAREGSLDTVGARASGSDAGLESDTGPTADGGAGLGLDSRPDTLAPAQIATSSAASDPAAPVPLSSVGEKFAGWLRQTIPAPPHSPTPDEGISLDHGQVLAHPLPSELKLSTIFCEADYRAAVINGRTIREGKVYRGYKVLRIEPTRVTLETPDGKPLELQP